jgi:hypothetical protein
MVITAARNAAEGGCTRKAQRNQQVDGTRTEQCHDNHRNHNVRDGVKDIDTAHDNLVHNAAVKARDRAQCHAD